MAPRHGVKPQQPERNSKKNMGDYAVHARLLIKAARSATR